MLALRYASTGRSDSTPTTRQSGPLPSTCMIQPMPRPPTCDCGRCPTCKGRERSARRREDPAHREEMRSIEAADAVAPLGGWRGHRRQCEARISGAAGPEFERGRAAGRELTLDAAVALALAGPTIPE
jgi:hypothetical protein